MGNILQKIVVILNTGREEAGSSSYVSYTGEPMM